MAVRVVEIAVTFAVPSLAMTFVLKRLEMTVPAEIIAEIKLAYERNRYVKFAVNCRPCRTEQRVRNPQSYIENINEYK